VVFDIDAIVQDFDIRSISIVSFQYILDCYGLRCDLISTMLSPSVSLNDFYPKMLTAKYTTTSESFVRKSASCYLL
jgi:hypothetical protein